MRFTSLFKHRSAALCARPNNLSGLASASTTRAGSLGRGTKVLLPPTPLYVRDYLTGDVDPK
jgi:hypothetical protein